MVNKTNLFIVGAQKSGTTALSVFLQSHNDIFVVRDKEAHIFDQYGIEKKSVDSITIEYQKFTSGYTAEQFICDATPIYMFLEHIPEQIYRYNPDAKIIICLREPAERALSQYHMQKKRGDELYTFPRALLCEPSRLEESKSRLLDVDSSWRSHSYRERGYYNNQIENILRFFPRKQVLIIKNSDLISQHRDTLDKVSSFLDIAPFTVSEENVFPGNYRVSFIESLTVKILKFAYFNEYKKLRKNFGIVFD